MPNFSPNQELEYSKEGKAECSRRNTSKLLPFVWGGPGGNPAIRYVSKIQVKSEGEI